MHRNVALHTRVGFIGIASALIVTALAPGWASRAEAPAVQEKAGAAKDQPAKEIKLTDALVIGPSGRGGRAPFPTDAVAAQIAAGTWTAPKDGDKLPLPDGKTLTWNAVTGGKDGAINHADLRGGYAYFDVTADKNKPMILEASGHLMAYVNGEPRAGDPYQHGYVRLPIELRAGKNHLLLQCGRGTLRARLVEPKASAQFNPADTLLPDFLVGQAIDHEAAVVIVNASAETLRDAEIQARAAGNEKPTTTLVPPIGPWSIRKCGVRLAGAAPNAAGDYDVSLTLSRKGRAQALDTTSLRLRVLRPEQTHKRTFRSNIDGSVQYYAVVPAKRDDSDPVPGLVLTLHGAGVEAIGQANCYAARPWCHVVAPTNRRP